ncbi:type IV pilin [Natrinema sp. H-ect1]|uniref:type IV pilin n=1 Tax=Natrinema sp. H-ect1 TaxID=3242700 RepID=UPI00359ECBCB
MVAITVILAAVIAAFVLDLGQGQSANAQAGIQFDKDTSNNQLVVTVNSVSRADDIWVSQSGCKSSDGFGKSASSLNPSAGSSETIAIGDDSGSFSYSGASSPKCDTQGSSVTIQVIGEVDGSQNVITEEEWG